MLHYSSYVIGIIHAMPLVKYCKESFSLINLCVHFLVLLYFAFCKLREITEIL